MYRPTTALRKILKLNRRLQVVQGGTSASKTISILLKLINMAQTETVSISVVSESLPHIKRGARKDFLNIMQTHRYFDEARWNRTDNIYTFETGSTIEFFGADSPDKVRGPRRDVLFINECNNVPYGVFDQLEVRTRKLIILDFNPVGEFWVHTEVIPHREHDFLKLTYLDNEALDPAIVQSIESRKHNENWWRVYGLGEIGVNEGQVFTNWRIIDQIPKDAELVRYGLDFGYTNDPSALVAIYRLDGSYIWHECLYRKGMSNKQIADVIAGLPPALVIADSAEPKSIDELNSYLGQGRVLGATKGPGSVNQRIQLVQDHAIQVTKASTNIIKEQRNYLWKTDRDGKALNVPEDIFNHAMDAGGYAMADLLMRKQTRYLSAQELLG